MSELSILDVVKAIRMLCPVKITFNDKILYNDYDSEIEIQQGIFGELATPLVVIPDRIKELEDYVVTDVNIKFVDFHHSIIDMKGVRNYES